MDRWLAMEAFVRVVESGTFVGAAERLGMSTSSLSRLVADLEQHLGARLLNVNVPDLPRAMLKGFRITRLGRRHKAENVVTAKSPRGETVYWVGAAGALEGAGAPPAIAM